MSLLEGSSFIFIESLASPSDSKNERSFDSSNGKDSLILIITPSFFHSLLEKHPKTKLGEAAILSYADAR